MSLHEFTQNWPGQKVAGKFCNSSDGLPATIVLRFFTLRGNAAQYFSQMCGTKWINFNEFYHCHEKGRLSSTEKEVGRENRVPERNRTEKDCIVRMVPMSLKRIYLFDIRQA
jgi:hypothetical protein